MLRVVRLRSSTWKCALLSLIGVLFLNGLPSSVVLASNHMDNPLTCSTINSANLTADRPNAQSLLIVLLDRGATMGLNGGGADPNNYSGSTADVLSDLWSGPMAVVAYQANRATTFGVGLSSARQALKQEVNNTQSGGNAPLDLALNQANALLQPGIPAGSRIAILSDAADLTGSKDALNTAASTFGHEGVPVYTFNLSSSSNQQVQPLLEQVSQTTNGCYENITSSADLAQSVVNLYAGWNSLEFTRIDYNTAKNDYPVTLDITFNSAAFLTFYDSSTSNSVLAIAGQQLPKEVVDRSLDNQHYELDTLKVPLQSGVYTVTLNTSAVNARVYALTQSTRTLQFVQPTASSIAYTGQSLPIEVHLVDKDRPTIPEATTVFQAQVTITFGNAPPVSESIALHQQGGGDIASGVFIVPMLGTPGNTPVRVGIIQITALSKDQGITHTTLVPVTIPVFIPKAPPCPTFQECVKQNIVGLLSLVLLLLIGIILLIWFLIWKRKPTVMAHLVSVRNPKRILELGEHRPWLKRIFRKSVITMRELETHPETDVVVELVGEPLAFVASDTDITLCMTGGGGSNISVKVGMDEQVLNEKQCVSLGSSCTIYKNGKSVVTFKI